MSRGQILERMTVVSAGAAAGGVVELEALWQPGVDGKDPAMPVIVAGPHPRLGGNMDSPACAEIVWHLARRGHPTLRFNWRGVGASTGASRVPWLPADEAPSLDDEIADLERAIEQHAAGAPCAVVGVSFGAGPAAAVAVRHPLVERVVLVAPPFGLLPFDLAALAASGVPVGVVAGGDDVTAPAAVVEREIARRFRLEIIAGANHGFTAGLVELGRRVANFLPGEERSGG